MTSSMSDEVAEDYRIALEALTLNSRYEISNLTVIAKENTEHALAISEALKNHIKTTSPNKKLPSFYVLDSVVKNVGTPYTLFFGRQLYATFMEAYALVDNNVRRKMDEMLKTWKEPVPGSMDTRPVFPPEVTRPIENALIKAKTSFLQAHQEHMRTQQQLTGRGRQIPPQIPYRETPTPPNVFRQSQQQQLQNISSGFPKQQYFLPDNQQLSSQPNGHSYPGLPNGHQYPVSNIGQHYPDPRSDQNYPNAQSFPQYPNNGLQYNSQPNIQSYPNIPNSNRPFILPTVPLNQPYIQPTSSHSWQDYASQRFSAGETSIDSLNGDVDRLIMESKAAWARNMQDTAVSTRLKALLDLQSILQNQKLPPDQISLIRTQVAQLSEACKTQSMIQAPRTPTLATSVQTPQTSVDSLLGPGALAALMARQNTIPPITSQSLTQFPSPQAPSSQPSYHPATHITNPNASTDSNVALLEKLRAAGIIGRTPATSVTNSFNFLPTVKVPPLININPSPRIPVVDTANDLVLKSASLKIPRPHLISNLYEKLGAPCSQCGRRFQADVEGKKKKEAHMDWHFRVRRRMEEAELRGQHRSWYVDELDWIKSREIDLECSGAAPDLGTTVAINDTPKDSKLEYIPVPDDAASSNSLCPICQEKFEMNWLDEAQEFVWMDARTIGEKTYHASCYAEVSKNIKSQNIVGTPETTITVLGKRKADDDLSMTIKTKIKNEPLG
ncbi:hypothetical protein HI914_02370 [Erysiphe necator]|uniref:Putative mrna cleavage factor complex component pcf11 n=1 Tax=Uncinula necator TaxID=52586 RepID=A0A0B1P8Q3_UNCNE|nr:hypothetical protein HI914_02370 [Erysiphe necator]KHJ33054.1 putative mrna cleavage factor complex component pcf11 [Erysiphe necator]